MTASVLRSRMCRWFPTTSYPLIISAPMDFVTNPKLATEVTKAGGFGFIQGGRDFKPGSSVIKSLDEQLSTSRKLLGLDDQPEAVLPIGVGFVAYAESAHKHFAETTVPVLQRHRPAAVWLFAPCPSRPGTIRGIISSLRQAASASAAADSRGWDLKVAVQVGNVAAAREAVQDGADIIVAQGVDAGGHQWASGAGIVSLVPEIADFLAGSEVAGRGREVALWAAGGIADGRGAAAALALGAEAAVLGTKYMVATESDAQDFKRQAILNTSDGGQNTVKSQIHDHVQGNMDWPELYDGRAVVHPSHDDQLAGVSLEENQKAFKSAKDSGDLSRMITWSGTGVGLITKELPAAEITRQVRDDTLKVISTLKSL